MTTPFARLELLLGPDALPRLARARVVVAGLGAVGAAAAESLARSAVGHLTLVDFDELRPSNLNRHPFAFHSTLRRPKAETAARFLRDINPAADITPLALFLDADTAPKLFADHPCDVLVDAIDSLNPQTELLLAAQQAFTMTSVFPARPASWAWKSRTSPSRLVSERLGSASSGVAPPSAPTLLAAACSATISDRAVSAPDRSPARVLAQPIRNR